MRKILSKSLLFSSLTGACLIFTSNVIAQDESEKVNAKGPYIGADLATSAVLVKDSPAEDFNFGFNALSLGFFGGYSIGKPRLFFNYFSARHISDLQQSSTNVNYHVNYQAVDITKTSLGVDYLFTPNQPSWFVGGGIMHISANLIVDTNLAGLEKEIAISGTIFFARFGYAWQHLELNTTLGLGEVSGKSRLDPGEYSSTEGEYSLTTGSIAISGKL